MNFCSILENQDSILVLFFALLISMLILIVVEMGYLQTLWRSSQVMREVRGNGIG
jgi:hypothetical protein